MRTEHDAAALPLRGPRRALAGAAGALLAVRLASTAAHVAAGLGGRGALAPVGQLAEQRLVHHRLVRLDAEDGLGKLDAAGLVAGLVDDVALCSCRRPDRRGAVASRGP